MASEEEFDRQTQQENDEAYRRELSILFKSLRMQAISNMEYFQVGKGYNHDRFHAAFHLLHEHLDRGIEPGVEYLLNIAYLYDFDSKSPGNGHRSLVRVINKCCLHLLQLTRHITVNRESFLFRGGHYSRELDAYVNNLGQLRACLHYLQKLVGYCAPGELFPSEDDLSEEDYRVAEDLMLEVESLNQEPFYGRCLGFQYCNSMTKPLTTINLMMASFGEGYMHNSTVMKLASSVLGGSKYFLDPELRAQQVVNVTRNSDVKFAKAFWSIAENSLMHSLPLMVCPPVQIDKVIVLPPETFELPTRNGNGRAKITPPCAHSGPGPVHTRLLSYRLHQGQEVFKSRDMKTASPTKNTVPRSKGLIIHCHGGGFVAQSSASHEMYLRSWAKETGVPILSVDYSLAPEYPFPRQLEEIFFAYCWALKNLHILGTTGEKICIVGDSAGGNMAIAVAMRAASYDIRVPDGALSVYGCMLVRYTPSPSRILSLMDALLPMGILAQCLAAYAGVEDNGINLPPVSQMFSHPKSPTEPEKGTLESADSTPSPQAVPAGRVRRHKSSGSGDSGYHEPSSITDDHLCSVTTATTTTCCHGDETQSHSYSNASLSDSATENDFVKIEDMVAVGNGCNCVVDDDAGNEDAVGNDFENINVNFLLCSDTPDVVVQNGSHSPSQSEASKTSSQSGPDDQEIERTASPTAESSSKTLDPSKETLKNPSKNETSTVRQADVSILQHGPANEAGDADCSKSKSSSATTSPSKPRPQVLNLDPRKLNLFPQKKLTEGGRRMIRSPSSPAFSHVHCNGIANDATHLSSFGRPEEVLATTPHYAKTKHFLQSPTQKLSHMPISRNPYMSPFLAKKHLLKGLCPVYLVACHLDPLLDDSVMFARKLKALGNEVHIDILNDLPHGFLNFVLISHDAKHGSDVCIAKMKQILKVKEKNLPVIDDEAWEVLEPEAQSVN